jgi:acyl-coenzyme A synthetase/AMP-(fatty) acid ligase
MLGYRGETQRTAETRLGEWFVTGDLARIDDEGYVFYEGRADDVINSAGYRIGPLEVENAVLDHPDVVECAVVGSPDPGRGEIVKAFVVLRAGAVGDDAMARALQEHVKRYTAPYKYPRRIEFIDALPKTASGKILRRELRARERLSSSPPPLAGEGKVGASPLRQEP